MIMAVSNLLPFRDAADDTVFLETELAGRCTVDVQVTGVPNFWISKSGARDTVLRFADRDPKFPGTSNLRFVNLT
jgi:hypothetical protein